WASGHLAANRVEQVAGAVEIDTQPLVEIAFCLAGYDRGQMKDDVGPAGKHPLGRALRREVAGLGRDREWRARGHLRRDDVDERHPLDRAAAEALVGDE